LRRVERRRGALYTPSFVLLRLHVFIFGLAAAKAHAMTYDWVRWLLEVGLGSDIPNFILSAIGTRPKLHGISQTTTFREV